MSTGLQSMDGSDGPEEPSGYGAVANIITEKNRVEAYVARRSRNRPWPVVVLQVDGQPTSALIPIQIKSAEDEPLREELGNEGYIEVQHLGADLKFIDRQAGHHLDVCYQASGQHLPGRSSAWLSPLGSDPPGQGLERERVKEMIDAAEARSDSKFERLLGDVKASSAMIVGRMDAMLERQNGQFERLDGDVKRVSGEVKQSLWALAGLIVAVAGICIALLTWAIGWGDTNLGRGMTVRDLVATTAKEQEDRTKAAFKEQEDRLRALLQKGADDIRSAQQGKTPSAP